MPHDWVNVHVFDGDDDHDRTIVKQCARCRMLAIVGETAATSAVDYYPQHVRAPQDCTRGDMAEERASEIAAVTEQRDLWKRQCDLTSERADDLLNTITELRARLAEVEKLLRWVDSRLEMIRNAADRVDGEEHRLAIGAADGICGVIRKHLAAESETPEVG